MEAMTIIDEQFDGIIDKGNDLYYYAGDLKFDNNVEIKINLEVDGCLDVSKQLKVAGSLDVKGWLNVGGGLNVGGWLGVEEWANVGWSLEVGESLEVKGLLEIKRHLEVGEWLKVEGTLNVGGRLKIGEIKSINGVKTSTVKIIHSDIYVIWVFDNHIKIGCRLYKKEEWANFTNKEIVVMDGKRMLEFWNRNKEWILKM